VHAAGDAACELCRIWLAAGFAACELSRLGLYYVAIPALLCMLRVMLLVSSAGSGQCHFAKLDLAWLCTLLGLLLVNSASL